MSPTSEDPHGILTDMEQYPEAYVTWQHIIYKAGTHGETYLNKDAYLQIPDVAERVADLIAKNISEWSVIIAPATSSTINLAKMVAERVKDCICIETKKVADRHVFDEGAISQLAACSGKTIYLVDDILNNGETLRQVQSALAEQDHTLSGFHVMVNRNPEASANINIPLSALAIVQINQWDENEVPDWLKARDASTKLGKWKNWKEKPGETMSELFFRERMAKEKLGFHFDDGMRVVEEEGKFSLVQR